MNRPKIVMAAWLLFGAGCAAGTGPRTYVLTPPAGQVAVPAPDPVQSRIQLQPVLLPDYLDTTDVLLRSGSHELAVSHSARWGERLSEGTNQRPCRQPSRRGYPRLLLRSIRATKNRRGRFS